MSRIGAGGAYPLRASEENKSKGSIGMGTVLVALLVACILAAIGIMVFGDDY